MYALSLSIPTVGVDDTVCLNHTRASLNCHLFIYTGKIWKWVQGRNPWRGFFGGVPQAPLPYAFTFCTAELGSSFDPANFAKCTDDGNTIAPFILSETAV